MHLEFQYLSQLTGKEVYLQKVSELHNSSPSLSLSLAGRAMPSEPLLGGEDSLCSQRGVRE